MVNQEKKFEIYEQKQLCKSPLNRWKREREKTSKRTILHFARKKNYHPSLQTIKQNVEGFACYTAATKLMVRYKKYPHKVTAAKEIQLN